MRKIGKWALACMAVAVMTAAAAGMASAAKIGVVDTSKVLKEYDKAKDAQTRLEKDVEGQKTELKKMSDKLEKQEADLNAKKGIVAQKQYDSMKSKFEEDREAFREKYKEVQGGLMKKQQDVMESIVNDVKEIVAQVGKADKYDVILDKQVALFGGEDITYKVLDQLNKKK
jgi:outer membrane protein